MPVLLLKLRLETVELRSDLSLPPSSGTSLPPCGVLKPASGARLPPGTATLMNCPLVPPESDPVALAFLGTGKSLAVPADDEHFLLMPDQVSSCAMIMVEPVGPGNPDSLGGFETPLVEVYPWLEGL